MAAAKVARVKKQLSASISELLNANRKSQPNLQDNGMSSVHQAALMGNMQILRMLIDSRVNLDALDAKGMTALHYATLHNTADTASVLLQNGAKVDVANCEGNTAFHIACQHGQIHIISLLLYYRADLFKRNKQGLTPFDCACEYGRTKAVELLLESGFSKSGSFQSIGKTSPLHLAAKNGHMDVLKILVKSGYDINHCLQQGTALHEAAVNGRFSVVKFLLQSGSDPYSVNANGQTALDIVRKQANSNDPNVQKIKQVLKEAQNAVYGKAICDYCARYNGELSFNYGDIIWILDRSDAINWKGVIFGPNYSARIGQFPASSVQIIDRSSGMQRSASQRQVKKVNVPIVPDIPGINGAEAASGFVPPPPYVTNNGQQLSCSSSYGSWPCVDGDPNGGLCDTMKLGQSKRTNSVCHSKAASYNLPTYNATHLNHCNGVKLPEAITMNSPARHRNSTGSNSSQSSSGFESMKSGSQTHTTVTVHNLRGDSPPSRNSMHSSGSSSLGSLERLDESGYASQVNVSEMAGNGIPDNEILSVWLHSLHYEEYIGLFLNAGYDLATVARMTPEDLTAIGITKPGHRKRLTTEIHKMNVVDTWPDKKPATLCEWLHVLGLLDYVPLFEAQGYSNMDQIMQLTWEDFEDIGVKKLGHLKKLVCAIKKLKDSKNQRSSTPAGQSCLTGVGEVLLINVPPQRTTAEIRPYAHLAHGPHSPQQMMSTFQQHSPRALSASQETLMYRPDLVQITPGPSPSHRYAGQQQMFFSNNSNYAHLNGETSANGYDTFPPRRDVLVNGRSAQEQHHYPTTSEHSSSSQVHQFVTTEVIIHQTDRPKSAVKPRPVAKIIAKTKRSSRDIVLTANQQNVIAYQDAVSVSCEDLKNPPTTPRSPLRQAYVNLDISGGNNVYENSTNCRSYASNTLNGLNKRHHQNGHQHVNQQQQQQQQHNSPSKSTANQIADVPPKKPPPPQAHVFQLSSHPCLDDSFELSPAPSVDEFPPPPNPLMCEEQIRHLRSIKDNPPVVDDDCLSQCGDHHGRIIAPVPAAYSDDAPVNCGTIVRRKPCPEGKQQNRNDSTASMDSNSSTETLPFAQENVGTIKQKNSLNNGGSSSSAPTSQAATPRRHVNEVFGNGGMNSSLAQKQCVSNHQSAAAAVNANGKPGDVLNDIGHMLQDLTDQLDALLCEPSSHQAS